MTKYKILNWFGENIWIFLTGSLFLGLFFPIFRIFKPYISYFLMIVLYVTFLNVEFKNITTYIKKPFLILYYIVINMVVSPLLLYLLFSFFTKNYAILSAVVILALVPSGAAASAMTDISGGDTGLTVILTIVSHLAAIILIPFMFFVIFRKSIDLDYFTILLDVTKLIGIPLVLAIVSNILFKEKVNFLKRNVKFFTVVPLVFVIAAIMAVNSTYLKRNPYEVLIYLLILYITFIFSQYFSFTTAYFLDLKQRIAVSNAKTFSNIALALVVASKHLNPETALIVALSQIPWPTMLISLRIMLRIFSKNKL